MKLTAICLLLGLSYLANAASTEKYRGYETPSYTVLEKASDLVFGNSTLIKMLTMIKLQTKL